LSKFLLTLFKKTDAEKPVTHIDTNVAAIPDLAIRAMTMELDSAIKAVNKLLLPTDQQNTNTAANLRDLEIKLNGLEKFIALTFKSELTQQQASLLTSGLSTSYYLKNACRTFQQCIQQYEASNSSLFADQTLKQWFAYVNESNQTIYLEDNTKAQQSINVLQIHYQEVKMNLFNASVARKLPPDVLDNALQSASYARRFIEQLSQAYAAFAVFSQSKEGVPESTDDQTASESAPDDDDNDTENNDADTDQILTNETQVEHPIAEQPIHKP
jgi:hypothetical protein